MPPPSSTACRLISRPPMTSTSPNGITAKVRKSGKTASHGASQWRNWSASAGTMSSLVMSFSGSAMNVLTMPRLKGRRPPKRFARFAPTRSWISAEPFRSTQSKRTVTCRQMTRATSARATTMITSIVSGPALVPVERADSPHVGESNGEDPDEHRHLSEAEPAEAAVRHGPRVQEHDLDVEDDEEDRDQVELHRKALAAERADRRVAGLEDLQLHLARTLRSEQPAHEQ